MELRQLRQFVAVAEAHSFRAAAERLFMAQPPLSVAVRKLEEEIGVSLFERGPRGVQLTAAGQTAFEMAQQCLAQADDVIAATRSAANGEIGRLRIGFIGSVTFALMPSLVRTFRERFPLVKLDLRESTNVELLSLVEAQDIDIAFVRLPATRPPKVEFRTIQEDVFCVALPPSHPLCAHDTLSMQDIADQTFIGYTPSRVGGLQAGMSQLMQQVDISLRVAQEAVQVQTVIGLVNSGLGIALVPSANVPYFSQSVAFRPIRDMPVTARIGIALAFHADRKNPIAARFLETVEEPAAGRSA